MSESRRAIEEAADRLFRDASTQATARDAESGVWPARLWDALEASGLPRVALSEDAGGAADWRGALALLRVAGKYFVPLPVAETVFGLWLLERAGLPLVDGPIALGPVMLMSPLDLSRECEVWRALGGIALSGRASRSSALLALSRDRGGRSFLVRLDPSVINIEERQTLAFEALSVVTMQGPGVLEAGALDGMTPERFRALGAATRVALMTGALEASLGLAVQYAQDRRQFGRPLAKFQAIQQQLAVLAGEVAASVMAFEALTEAFDTPLFDLEVAIAKARVSEAAGAGAAIAHQVHGAMGFTHEYGLHLLTKRLLTWRDEYGSEREWQKKLGRFAARIGSAELWNTLASKTV